MNPQNPLSELAIPTDGLEKAFLVGAVPGFFGFIEVGFCIKPSALDCLTIWIHREATISAKSREERPMSGAPERELMVRKAIEAIRPELRMKIVLAAARAHFADGKLEKITPVAVESAPA